MLYISPRFSNLQEAQAVLSHSAFFLLDIHQVLFHRKGILPLVRGLLKIKKKPRTFKEGVTALCSKKTWQALRNRYKEGNRITEAYLNAAQSHPLLYSELLDYSNNIYTPDSGMQTLLTALKNQGHALYLLSNIGYTTLERLRQDYPDYFKVLSSPHNTINQHSLKTDTFIWKPQAIAYEHALNTIQKLENPHHVIFIDDTKRNVQAAHKAGINAILFTSFAQCKRDIEAILGKKF